MEKNSSVIKNGFITEFERKESKLKIPLIIAAALLVLSVLGVAAFLFSPKSLGEVVPIVGVAVAFSCIMGIVGCIAVYISMSSEIKTAFKIAAASVAFEKAFGKVGYPSSAVKSAKTDEEARKLFPFNFHSIGTEGRATGEYGRTKVEARAVTAYLKIIRQDTKFSEHQMISAHSVEDFIEAFKGIWLSFELERKPDFELRLTSRGVLDKLAKTKTIETGDENFDKRFNVSSNDTARAKAFLSKSMTAFLLEKTKNITGDCYICFSESGMLNIAVKSGNGLFKTGAFFNLEKASDNMLEKIKIFTDIFDEFEKVI